MTLRHALFGVLIVLSGCRAENESSAPPPLQLPLTTTTSSHDLRGLSAADRAQIELGRRAVVDNSAFAAELRVPRETRIGQPVPMELVVRNASERPVWVEYGDSNHAFDFTIDDANGGNVWDRTQAKQKEPDYAILHSRPLAPGDAIRFSDTWDSRGASGRPLPPGRYSVRGTFDADAKEAPAKTDDVTAPTRILTVIP